MIFLASIFSWNRFADRADESRSYRWSYVVRVMRKKKRDRKVRREKPDWRTRTGQRDAAPIFHQFQLARSGNLHFGISIALHVPRGDELSSPRNDPVVVGADTVRFTDRMALSPCSIPARHPPVNWENGIPLPLKDDALPSRFMGASSRIEGTFSRSLIYEFLCRGISHGFLHVQPLIYEALYHRALE